MFRLKIICHARNAPGFALAGFECEAYQEMAEAELPIARALEQPEYGVLIVDEAVVATLDHRMVRRLELSDRPLVVAIPMGVTEPAEREYLERVIRRVIGYQVRLK